MKIKILLAAYVNYPNAQNINCDNIARHLDKSKFDVHCLYLSEYPVNEDEYNNLKIHLHSINPYRGLHQITLWKTLILGNYDIYYLPKVDPEFRWFADHFHQKKLMVSSVEGVITPGDNLFSKSWYADFMTRKMFDIFSISTCIANSVKQYYSLDTAVLPLGVKNTLDSTTQKDSLNKIIWCGSLIPRKRPQWLLKCAKEFPRLQFVMVGDGELQRQIQSEIEMLKIKNITMTGRIPNHEVYRQMASSDLLLMTSEFEGLPKVIQEAAQCGLPSIYMSNNYTVDFIQDGVNGYAVTSLDEMISKVRYLLETPDVYQSMSQKAVEVIGDYTWEKLIPRYETWFSETLKRYRIEKGI